MQVVAGVCHSIVYGLMCFVLNQFHAETLGSDVQVLHSVIAGAFVPSSALTMLVESHLAHKRGCFNYPEVLFCVIHPKLE